MKKFLLSLLFLASAVAGYCADPVATDGAASGDEDAGPITGSVIATDADGDNLTYSLVSGVAASAGTLNFNTDGTYSFTPAANFNGTVTFTYVANDGAANSNTATVTITVNPVNDAPVAGQDGPVTTPEDVPVTVDVLSNDNDVDGDPMTIQVTSTTNGTAIISNGQVVFTPSADFNGTANFKYRLKDPSGAISNTITVTVNVTAVNDAPVANAGSASGLEDGGAITGTVNAADADGDALTYSVVSGVTAAQGTLTLNATTGAYSFTPAANFNGTATFTYKANDGTTNSNTATVTITVTAVNDAPTVSDVAKAGTEDVTVTFASTDFTSKFSDVDGDNLTKIKITSLPSNGTLKLGAGNVTLNQEIAVANLGTLTFVPATNFNGSASFGWNGFDGTSYAASGASVNITLAAVNDAPTAVADVATTPEDVPKTIDVLANDSDPDDANTSLTIQLVGTPTSGTATVSNGKVVFTPASHFNGAATFQYKLIDPSNAVSNTVTVTVNVSPVYDITDKGIILNEFAIETTIANQFFELYNSSTSPINLDCYSIVCYSASPTELYVIDLPNVTLDPGKWFVGAGSATPVLNGGGTFTPDFNWNAGITALANMGASFKVYKKTGGVWGGTDITTATPFYFDNGQSKSYSVFLFSSGFYVNGFSMKAPASTFTGLGTINNLTNPCGTYNIDWSQVTTVEMVNFATGTGNVHGAYRAGDGICGGWTKLTQVATPDASNNPGNASQPSVLTTVDKITCSSTVSFKVTGSSDPDVYPITVEFYYDNGTIGTLDKNDVLQDSKTIANAAALPYSGTFIYSPSSQKVLLVYRTALGCVSKIVAPTSTASITTTQYTYCNKQIGVAITAADAGTTAYGFPVTVKFFNNGTQIGSANVPVPSTTIYYSNILTTAFNPAQISVQYVFSNCLTTQTATPANSTFTAATGTLQTNEVFVSTVSGHTFPGQIQARVTGISSTTGFIEANTAPVKADLYYENDPNSITDDVLIESYTFPAFSSTYHVFNHVFTYEQDNGKEVKVVYTPQLGCPAIPKVVSGLLSPLPVTFKSFKAVRKDDSKVALNWTTVTEQNNRGFHVQRNTGSGWQDIAFVFSAADNGTSNQELSYSYTDVNPNKGVSQYRLLQVDLSGKGRYSEIRSVKGNNSGKLLLYPNPSSTGSVTLLFDAEGAKDVVVSDASGRLVQQFKKVMGNSLVIRNLNNGFYTVRVQEVSTAVSTTEKFIITKR